MSNIDSDDEFIICDECGDSVDLPLFQNTNMCNRCYEKATEDQIAQPFKMVPHKYFVYNKIKYIIPNDVNYFINPKTGKKIYVGHNGACDMFPTICNSFSVYGEMIYETNGMRKTRLQEEKKQKEEEEEAKQKKQLVLAEKKQKERQEKEQKLAEEKFAAYLQQKEKWENLTIGTKIAQLEVQICHKLNENSPNWNSYAGGGDGGLGQRVMLYENYRFKELQKTCPVIEQASRAIYNFTQAPHLQIENPFEKKDQIEKILEILEKWLKEI